MFIADGEAEKIREKFKYIQDFYNKFFELAEKIHKFAEKIQSKLKD